MKIRGDGADLLASVARHWQACITREARMTICRLLPLIVAIFLGGCKSNNGSELKTAQAPARKAFATISLQAAQQLTSDEAKAIVVARAAVEEAAAKAGEETPQIMEFRVSRNQSGWIVHVQYIGGWFEGRPIGMAGFFSDVFID